MPVCAMRKEIKGRMDASQRVPSMHPDTALSAAMAYLESRECCTARDLGQHFGWPPRARDAILQQAIANGYARKITYRGRVYYRRIAKADLLTALRRLNLPTDSEIEALCRARTCYDHLAGYLGVCITHEWITRHWLLWDTETKAMTVTDLGHEQIRAWRLVLPNSHRPLVRACLDWTEKSYHVGGQLGAALASTFNSSGWVIRGPSRSLILTPAGTRALARRLPQQSQRAVEINGRP
jgi:hypothetical protein